MCLIDKLKNLKITKKNLKINVDASKELKTRIIYLFKKYKDIFAWLYKDLKRISIIIFEHIIYVLLKKNMNLITTLVYESKLFHHSIYQARQIIKSQNLILN